MFGGPITNEDYQKYDATQEALRKDLGRKDADAFVDGALWAMAHPDLRMLDFIFYHNASFTRYSFFTKKLWRKVKGFKDADQCDVHAAFIHWWLNGEYGLNRYPVGCTWCGNHDSKEFHDNYLKKYEPVFKAYQDWCYNQR